MPEIIGNFMFVLHSHLPYVLSHGKTPHGTDWLTEAAAESYLPILGACERLVEEGISPKFTINFSPILQEQLADEQFKTEFISYLDDKVRIAGGDQKEFLAQGDLWRAGLACFWQEWFSRRREEFVEKYDRNILAEYRKLQDCGHLEVITCAATHGYLPLLASDECVQAQIKLGVQTYVRHFGRPPRGIWLPECAYRPAYEWQPPVGEKRPPFWRKGVEEFLAENCLEYFFVDSHLLRGGMPIGTYAERFPALEMLYKRFNESFQRMEGSSRSEYEAYQVGGSGAFHEPVYCFARDPETTAQVWSGAHGYPGDASYLEFHKQHYPGRLKYWRISEDKENLGAKQLYEPLRAFDNISAHADHFVDKVKSIMREYKDRTGRTGCMVSMYDTELFGHWWFEGPEWLYEVTRRLANDPEIRMVTGSEQLERNPPTEAVSLPEGSWGEGGYHYIWLNEDNAWTWERIYPAEREFTQAVRDYGPNTAVQPILKQAARELLLAESSDWQFLISTWSARDYAELRCDIHLSRFKDLLSMAAHAAENGQLTEEENARLEEYQTADCPFPDLDLTWWASIERPAESGLL